jgi:hypothetical protein
LRPAVAVAGAALLAVPIAAALLLRPGMGAQASATPASPTPAAPSVPSVRTHPGFPSPPLGAVVFARQFGHDDLALGLVPQSGRVLAQASVVSGQGVGVAGLHVSFSVDGARHTATACGRGCYRATLPMTGSPAAVVVDVAGGPATSWRVALPSPWPQRRCGRSGR